MELPISENKCYIKSELIRGRSRLIRMVSVPPIKFIAPESHASGALCFISSYGGGMLGGDSVAINVEISEDSALVLLPQANSRAYTNTDGKLATQYMKVDIKKGGRFIFNADPLVLHEQSRYAQDTEINIDAGAGAIIIDWFSIGRSENGEKFLFSEYSSSLKISDTASTFLIDKQFFSPQTNRYNIAGAFSSYSQMLNIFFVGESILSAKKFMNNDSISSNSNDYIYSFTNHERYTILRILGYSRQRLQSLLNKLFFIISQDNLIGFNALERKM